MTNQQILDALKSGETLNYGGNGQNMDVVNFMEGLRAKGLIEVEDMGLPQETRMTAKWIGPKPLPTKKPADTPEPAQVTVQDSFSDLVASAITEAEKAMRKFPQPNYVLLKVAEEAGEVVKACVHYAEGRETRENVEGEMRQTIAMLYRLWVEGDEVNGVRAIAGGRDE